MAKIIISHVGFNVSESATNPYLSADGQVDTVAFGRLNAKITSANTKLANAAKAAAKTPTSVRLPKLASPIFYSRKEIAKYSAASEKKNDHKYKVLRGQQIKSRTKMPAADSRVKVTVLLQGLYEGADKTLAAEVKKAISAITAHNKKAIKVVDKVKVEKAKIRDAANAEFDKNVDVIKAILLAGGIKETNIVVGQSMFGKVVHVKLPNGGVVTIGKSDDTKLRAAKKMNQAASK